MTAHRHRDRPAVLFVQGAGERGGAERCLSVLARGLLQRGVPTAVLCHSDGPFTTELRDYHVPVLSGRPLPRARQLSRYPAAVAEIAAAARACDATIIQGNGERVAIFSGWASRRAHCRCVHWLHDAPLRDLPSSAVQMAMASSPADARVTTSRWMAEEFRRRLHLQVRFIPAGIDVDSFPAAPADITEEAGWAPASPVVGFFGRLQRWKGAEVFLQACARVTDVVPEARFVVVGGALYGWEEEYARSLPGMAQNLGIADRVWFAGHRDDALAVMRRCDVVVHASLRPEPLGIVVIEAMALGRAVVATRSRGPEELIEHGRNGFLVDPGDAPSTAVAISRLLTRPAERERLGAAAARTAGAWSADAMLSGFCDLYREIGGSGR